ncbi:MAG TPA: PHP domain-containing protein, partial [Mycobacterium sp.]
MLPADNHVHSEFSWDTGVNASMEKTCRRAVEVGLPAVAFTEHVDFTAWGVHDNPPAGGQAAVDGADGSATAEIARRLRVQPLDVDRYLASIETCRARFPALHVLSGIEAGEPHHFGGSVAAVLRQGRFDRVLGSLHSIVHDGQLVYADHVFKFVAPDVVVRDYFAELLRLVENSDVFQVLAHCD